MREFGFQRDMSPKDPLWDVAIGIALIVGTWLTNKAAAFFFPEGLPLQLYLLLLWRDFGTSLWVFAMTTRYLSFAYYDLNSTINRISRSRTWNRSVDAIARVAAWIAHKWSKLDQPARYLTIIIVILLISFAICLYTGNLFYLTVPPVYWGGIFYFSYQKERKSNGTWKPTEKYWLSALLIFLILVITISTAMIGSDLIHGDLNGRNILVNNQADYNILFIAGTALYIVISYLLRRPRHHGQKGKSFPNSKTFLMTMASLVLLTSSARPGLSLETMPLN
jgi:hypothetical protein